MFGISGRPLSRPIQASYSSGTFSSSCRAAQVWSRLVLLFGLLAGVVAAPASVYTTNDPADVMPTESVYLTGITPYSEGVSPTGLRYRITQNEADQWYSGRYIQGAGAVRNVLHIEFDRPVAAIGAQLLIAGFDTGSISANGRADGSSVLVSESGYYGVVASAGSLREATFVSTSGPVSVSRIDVRPFPVAVEDSVDVYENSQRAYDAGSILANDRNAEGAVLVSPPLHAAYFELHDDGSFIYRPAKDYHGVDSILYRATNGAGMAVSEPAAVTFRVLPVNCAPSFLKGPDVACREDDGPQIFANWAQSISSGPEGEDPQSIDWQITTSNDSLFAVKPALSQDGQLTFQPASHESGVAQVFVRLHDSGGTANGGIDKSDVQSFSITVTPREHAPVLDPIPDCVVRDGDALILRVKGSEVDDSTPIVYSLDQAPPGAAIDSLSGQIVWRPSSGDTGSILPFVVRATETGSGQFSTATSFRVEVLETAKPPAVAPIPDVKAIPGADVHLRVSSSGTGARFFLASPVSGATLDSSSGQFTWKPTIDDAGKSYRFAVSVVDSNSRGLCTVRAFSVQVGTAFVRKPNNKSTLLARSPRFQTTGQAAMEILKEK